MKLISFQIAKQHSYIESSPMICTACIITDAGVKMEVQFTPELCAVAMQGVAEMVKVAVARAVAPIAKEKMHDPTLALTLDA